MPAAFFFSPLATPSHKSYDPLPANKSSRSRGEKELQKLFLGYERVPKQHTHKQKFPQVTGHTEHLLINCSLSATQVTTALERVLCNPQADTALLGQENPNRYKKMSLGKFCITFFPFLSFFKKRKPIFSLFLFCSFSWIKKSRADSTKICIPDNFTAHCHPFCFALNYLFGLFCRFVFFNMHMLGKPMFIFTYTHPNYLTPFASQPRSFYKL